MSYLKLEFKFQITIPKFEGEGGHVYTVVVIYPLKAEEGFFGNEKKLITKIDILLLQYHHRIVLSKRK